MSSCSVADAFLPFRDLEACGNREALPQCRGLGAKTYILRFRGFRVSGFRVKGFGHARIRLHSGAASLVLSFSESDGGFTSPRQDGCMRSWVQGSGRVGRIWVLEGF